jgi:N-acyl homoserine lactone hydrolase
MKIFLLNGGQVDVDRSVIHPGDESHQHILLPVPQILIDTGEKRILIDTGMPRDVAGGGDAWERTHGRDADMVRPVMETRHFIAEQLRLLDLMPADIDLPICSHLHFDHAGGNDVFSGRAITVQAAELEAAKGPSYLQVWNAPGVTFNVVVGDWTAAPGIEMIFTPGHSAGHQSVLVRFAEGPPWLFTIDTVDTQEHWDANKIGSAVDVPTARASLDRLKAIAASEGARVIFGHDPGQWEELGMHPDSKPLLLASD